MALLVDNQRCPITRRPHINIIKRTAIVRQALACAAASWERQAVAAEGDAEGYAEFMLESAAAARAVLAELGAGYMEVRS